MPVSMLDPSVTLSATATATPLGDPIEVAALTKAFQAGTSDKQFCAVGSVKSNIGHLDVSAGIVGLIKTALSLKHGVIPASLHFTAPNPQIDFASTPFYVNSKLTEWPRTGAPRRAGVSAFGVGGTNVHVVLEEAPPVETREANTQASELLIVSARSETAPGRSAHQSRRSSALESSGVAG